MSARVRSIAMVVLLPLFGACERVETTSVEPPDDVEAVLADATLSNTNPRNGGGVPLFDRLAEQIEGFGGLFRTDRCSIGLVLTDLSKVDHAKQIVAKAFNQLMDRACPTGIGLAVQQGEFTYVQLKQWLAAAGPLIGGSSRDAGNTSGVPGVFGLEINFSKNRLVVKVTDPAVASAVLEALPKLGIPTDAVIFEVGQPPVSRPR